jgi:hypothetical protein
MKDLFKPMSKREMSSAMRNFQANVTQTWNLIHGHTIEDPKQLWDNPMPQIKEADMSRAWAKMNGYPHP